MARLGGRGHAFFCFIIFRQNTLSRRGDKNTKNFRIFVVPECIYVIPFSTIFGVRGLFWPFFDKFTLKQRVLGGSKNTPF